jgi:hypothetical protein
MSDSAGLEAFLNKYQTARNYGSKEIRLTMQEAESLSIAISKMLTRENELGQRVINLQDQLINGIEVTQDGGRF